MRAFNWLTWLGTVLMLVGVILLAYVLWTEREAAAAQRRAKHWLEQQNAQARKSSTTLVPLPSPVLRGDVIGQLEVPRLHLSVAVFEGDDASILKLGAGHIPKTALPEESGNIGIAAHRDSYFRALRLIRPDDAIALGTPKGRLGFMVTETEIVRPSDIQVLAPAPGRDLTLVTCYPFYYVGSAPQRFIVHARRVE